RRRRGVSCERPRRSHCSGSGGIHAWARGAAPWRSRRRRLRHRRSAPARTRLMHRSEITVDLGALRRNVRTLLRSLEGSELWAVVKANGYGHGMVDAAGAALGAGAAGLCVAPIPEGLALRNEFRIERILV